MCIRDRFYISRARASGDLRYLGYAEGMLAPWLSGASARSVALVLDATVLQSRHCLLYTSESISAARMAHDAASVAGALF